MKEMNERQPSFIKALAHKIIILVSEELGKSECRLIVKENIISPLINMIYMEIFPYILMATIAILSIFLFSLATLVCFVVFYVIRK